MISLHHLKIRNSYLATLSVSLSTTLRSNLSLFLQDLSSFLGIDRGIILGISILTWIGHLILKHLDEFVKEDCNQGSKNWSSPYFISAESVDAVSIVVNLQ